MYQFWRKLKMTENQMITINNVDFPVKEYHNQRVLTFKDIDTAHQRPEGTARRNFTANKSHFIEGEDYCESNLDITDDEVMNTLFDKFLKRNCIFKDETCNPDTEKFVEYIHSVFHIDRSDLYATFCKALKESLEVNNGDLLLKLEMFDNNRSRFGRDKFHNDWHSSIFFPYSYTTSCF